LLLLLVADVAVVLFFYVHLHKRTTSLATKGSLHEVRSRLAITTCGTGKKYPDRLATSDCTTWYGERTSNSHHRFMAAHERW